MKTYSIIFIFLNIYIKYCLGEDEIEESNARHFIEGKVVIQGDKLPEWTSETRVLVNGGEYVGFLKGDGSFIINDVPSGSYIVEVASPNHLFEPMRVDINAKRGKIRARKVNFLQNSAVVTQPYPLKFKTKEPANFFEKREAWKIKDFLFNPMVLMMVLPLLLLLVLPKMMGQMDPETQKEMNSMNMFNQSQEMPEFSDMLTNWFSSGSKKKPVKTVAKKTPTARRR
ncbi:ER membrane protein complex subunit 7-like [Dendronephthya gigantea]|uniref:ER membrane protein complex subunit 7-like n=1 Tax=Dendronephthya gigantea TaxID=151771 RepID=UPI00106C0AD0|nr:ER membrane protein complex subunit 7-like [Dendronephthya gigantea]